MAGFRAVKASTSDEIFKAVKGSCPVIAIDNKSLFKKVEEMSTHDVKLQESANKTMKGGVAAVGSSIGIAVLGTIGGMFFAPLEVVGVTVYAFTFVGGTIATALGVGKKVWANISTEMDDYKWFESGKYLILYKYKGLNKFDPEKDTVDIKEEA